MSHRIYLRAIRVWEPLADNHHDRLYHTFEKPVWPSKLISRYDMSKSTKNIKIVPQEQASEDIDIYENHKCLISRTLHWKKHPVVGYTQESLHLNIHKLSQWTGSLTPARATVTDLMISSTVGLVLGNRIEENCGIFIDHGCTKLICSTRRKSYWCSSRLDDDLK